MLQSMTGFGKASYELDDKVVSFEIKSLNSKQLDIYLKLPGAYREKEIEIRNEISNRLKRGKIEVAMVVEYKEGKQATQINVSVVKNYYNQLKAISEEIGITGDEPVLQAVLRLPDAIINEKEMSDTSEWEKLKLTFITAVDELMEYRFQEGSVLEHDIISRIGLIGSFLEKIETYETERSESLRNKLNNSLVEFIPEGSIDKNRFEQELIYYFEKLDISEEKTRLKHHCSYFLEVIKEPEQTGRKLGFVAQEIGREINTIGSKANHSGMQKQVVLMKDELEKIKEQLMNVL